MDYDSIILWEDFEDPPHETFGYVPSWMPDPSIDYPLQDYWECNIDNVSIY